MPNHTYKLLITTIVHPPNPHTHIQHPNAKSKAHSYIINNEKAYYFSELGASPTQMMKWSIHKHWAHVSILVRKLPHIKSTWWLNLKPKTKNRQLRGKQTTHQLLKNKEGKPTHALVPCWMATLLSKVRVYMLVYPSPQELGSITLNNNNVDLKLSNGF